MKFAVYPYKSSSQSAKLLAESLGCKLIKHTNSHFNHWDDPKWWVINWGSTKVKTGASVMNSGLNVSIAANKLTYFNLIKDYTRVPEFTEDKEKAIDWLNSGFCSRVVCRTLLNDHSGNGIYIAGCVEEVVDAPLYTKYIPKDSEWRLHYAFHNETPFFIQRKRRKTDTEQNNLIRNLANGWVYCETSIDDCPSDVLLQGRQAFGKSNLDFAALDLIYRTSSDRAYVLEANTGPGLQGPTLNAYRDIFLGLKEHG